MAEESNIGWCDGTVNLWWGCEPVSPACDHCYAEQLAKRWKRAEWGPYAPRVPVKTWRGVVNKLVKRSKEEGRRMRAFAHSMSDVFDRRAPPGMREELFKTIRATRDHLDWLLLTKRVSNIPRMLPADWVTPRAGRGPIFNYPNVWLGISVCNQKEAERDIPRLANIDAPLKWISYEPALGELDLAVQVDWYDAPLYLIDMLQWVVVGGESGPKHRTLDVGWVERVAADCQSTGRVPVPVYVKQDSGLKPGLQGRIPDDIWAFKQIPGAAS